MKRLMMFLCFILLAVCVSQMSFADTITFTDKTEFLDATGAVSNGEIPNLGNVGLSETLNNIEFTSASGNIYFGTGGSTLTAVDGTTFDDWTALIDGPDIAISGLENMNVTVIGLVDSVYSIGFDFVEPTSGTVNVQPNDIVDSTFNVRLYNSASSTEVGSFNFNAIDDTAYFVGAWSNSLFDTVEIREIVGTHDNEFFGQFYFGTTAAPVPEPATMLLLGSGLAGLVAFRRRKHRK